MPDLPERAHPAPPPTLPGIAYKGLSRVAPIPPCVLSIADLRRLYAELAPKAQEALDKYLDTIQPPPDRTTREFAQVRSLGTVTVAIDGAGGEQLVYSTPDVLDALPDTLKYITFDSAVALQNHNITPNNRFQLKLDFTEPPGFDVYNPWDQPTPNTSRLEVVGTDNTWVTGVFESIMAFFHRRTRRRSWLHSHGTFNLLNWLIGFPAALWGVYRLDSSGWSVLSGIHTALRGALYVYVFLVGLLLFRGIVYGFRWLFPIIELEGARTKATRGVLGLVLSSLLLALLYDVLRTLL